VPPKWQLFGGLLSFPLTLGHLSDISCGSVKLDISYCKRIESRIEYILLHRMTSTSEFTYCNHTWLYIPRNVMDQVRTLVEVYSSEVILKRTANLYDEAKANSLFLADILEIKQGCATWLWIPHNKLDYVRTILASEGLSRYHPCRINLAGNPYSLNNSWRLISYKRASERKSMSTIAV